METKVTESFVIAVVVLWLQGAFVPSLLFFMGRDLGPKPLNWGFTAAVVLGGVVALVLHGKLALPFSPLIWIVFGMWATYLPGYFLHQSFSQSARDLVKFAPEVVKVGVSEFDRIDVGGRGEIRASDIYTAIEEGRVDQQYHAVLRHMAANIASIGHVVQVFSSGMPDVLPAMIHGISLEDLNRHEGWIEQHLSAWR